ncbi:MAG: ActS/PrrB/RegB family redox-sensitive histidine kinase [Alphaproteobacteria bacterium]|nr:ActS/PrrB/RegB family redox-sensitive histidine kinase [Alphaproteobacteria bacterium]
MTPALTPISGGFAGLTVGLPPAAGGRVRLKTLVLIRWVALVGQAAAILVVGFLFSFPTDVVSSLLTVGVSALLNLFLMLRYPATTRLSDVQAGFYLAYDILQLTVLLYLNGGIANPFAILVLVPATIAATILSLRSTLSLVVISVVCLTLVTLVHQPLPWSMGFTLPSLYVAGIWVALVLGMGFITVYAWRVAAESRLMADALAATQLALAREQRFSALGALAAAAAHELGTPLGTITLVAKELSRELPKDGPHAEDVSLLVSESERCRDILAQLSRRPEGDPAPFDRLALPALVDSIVTPLRGDEIEIQIDVQNPYTQGDPTVPVVSRRPEILHGLGNIVENAIDFAATRVTIRVSWDTGVARLTVLDDGPGFAASVLGIVGEPYVTTRRDQDGMGLGLFIAKTLLERTGATVLFSNAQGGGAHVAILWPRALLEAAP